MPPHPALSPEGRGERGLPPLPFRERVGVRVLLRFTHSDLLEILRQLLLCLPPLIPRIKNGDVRFLIDDIRQLLEPFDVRVAILAGARDIAR